LGTVSPSIRRALAAGRFYPSDPARLRAMIDAMLARAETSAPRSGASPVALVVPHAGYVYSGPVAASAYSLLRAGTEPPRRVVVLGPAHFVFLEGASVPCADAWETPLGVVPVDAELREAALSCGAVEDDRPHAPEHAVEVQIPFLQQVLGSNVPILPIAVGATDPGSVADLIETLASEATLVVISTDLSHYHDAEMARRLDERTARAVVDLDVQAITPDDACGSVALQGIVERARRQAMRVSLLDLRNSADTAGEPDSVVGYGAFVVQAEAPHPPE